jgi:hypothetical protein
VTPGIIRKITRIGTGSENIRRGDPISLILLKSAIPRMSFSSLNEIALTGQKRHQENEHITDVACLNALYILVAFGRRKCSYIDSILRG